MNAAGHIFLPITMTYGLCRKNRRHPGQMPAACRAKGRRRQIQRCFRIDNPHQPGCQSVQCHPPMRSRCASTHAAGDGDFCSLPSRNLASDRGWVTIDFHLKGAGRGSDAR